MVNRFQFRKDFTIKKNRRLIFILVFVLLSFLHGRAQSNCELNNLSSEKKDELVVFWNNFRMAVINHKSESLAEMCNYPFWVLKNIIKDKKNYSSGSKSIDEEELNKYIPKLFFEEQFSKSLLSADDPLISLTYHGDANRKDRTCSYVYFYYHLNGKGQESKRAFSIMLFGNHYKIVSHWELY